jgi:hypothetical protein
LNKKERRQYLDLMDRVLMPNDFIAYIDEAGDEGLSKLRDDSSRQSRWLMLGGIVVSAENDKLLPLWRDEALALSPTNQRRDLHFREMKHEMKVAVTQHLAEKRLGICCIASNKTTLLDGGKYERLYSVKGHLYNYLTRFLLERITASVGAVARKSGEPARLRVVFSRRANTDYHAMREYLEFMRDGKEQKFPVRSIDWSVFDPADIAVENHKKWAGLQLADAATSAVFSALEPNFYGNHEPRYALALARRFISRRKGILDCGFTLVPPLGRCPLSAEQRRFVEDLADGWRAPGS